MDGLGVLINRLGGNKETIEAYDKSVGKIIDSMALEGKTIRIRFVGGSILAISDAGQSCCESRYITTNDDLPYFSNTKLLDILLKDAPSSSDEYGDPHDMMFLNIVTEKGTVTFETHNAHNGGYSGFSIILRAYGGAVWVNSLI